MKLFKNKIFLLFFSTVIFMLIIPFIMLSVLDQLDVLGFIFLALFVIYPIFSLVVGIVVGRNLKKLWYVPLINFVIFPMLYWIVLETIEFDFYLYSLGYLVVSCIAMFLTYYLKKK